MNLNQKQSVLNQIQQIKELDLDEHFIRAFPNEPDIRNVNIKKYNAVDLKSLLKKSINSLHNELNSPIGLILPIEQNFNNEYGNINIEISLRDIYNYIINNKFEFVEREVDKLIFYQLSFGFWEKSRIKQHPYQEDEVKTALNAIQLGKKSLDKLLNNSALLENRYSKQIEESEQLIAEKTKQFNEITILEGVAFKHVESIKSNLEKSEFLDRELSGTYDKHKKLLIGAEDFLEVEKKAFAEHKEQISTLAAELNNALNQGNQQLDQGKKSLDFMESKESEIKKLTGYAADGALGSKFDERQTNLSKHLKWWMGGVILTAIASLFWIFVVFTILKTEMDDKWLTLIVNVVKTTPGFILLGFVISHYNRERAIQEEYAFKSAVAMTLTAYAEMLENADQTDNDSRQRMLCKAIEQLYSQPKIHPETRSNVYAFNTRHLTEAVKNLTDVVKEVKS